MTSQIRHIEIRVKNTEMFDHGFEDIYDYASAVLTDELNKKEKELDCKIKQVISITETANTFQPWNRTELTLSVWFEIRPL